MKIAVNTLSITPTRGGAKTYLTNLIQHLAKYDRKNTYFLFVSHLNEGMFGDLGDNFRAILIPIRTDYRPLRFLCEQFLIPFYIRKYKIDVLFSPGNVATLFPECRQVLVIQGPLVIKPLRQRYASKEIPKFNTLFYNLMIPLSVRRANKIIVVSKNIREWLLEQVKVPPTKLKVVYEGVDIEFFSTNNEMLEVKHPYILFISTLFRYKGADKSIKAFAKTKLSLKNPHTLVIVGRDPGGQIEKLKRLAKNLGVLDSVCFLGRLAHEQVVTLYRHADLFLYPSSVESFGLPPLEAMACGVPVISSNRCSVPEIVGDAGLIVDPDNIEEMADAIHRLLSNQELRNRLIQKGYKRMKMFRWERTAEETLKVFEEVCQEK